ncbi:hypothetical protein M0811_13846 [Anaeramoeba ignava]|uniref:Uncharacterized protein n=1 Tax=Anaeramoeba ignava TaxID=1746090 RepID=A0A9Q0LXI7_ANAIG|nr:hypothetical protein M0811_13846 [Anaeramoeba ignava]
MDIFKFSIETSFMTYLWEALIIISITLIIDMRIGIILYLDLFSMFSKLVVKSTMTNNTSLIYAADCRNI